MIAFAFPQEAPANRYYWLRVERGDAEVCYSDPGGEPDVTVVAESLAFVDWHRGRLPWLEVIRAGRIQVTGSKQVARVLPTWNLHSPAIQLG
ncbi:hypothetical protein BH23ACT5_BH23ACT5_15180 [soil metagenome]